MHKSVASIKATNHFICHDTAMTAFNLYPGYTVVHKLHTLQLYISHMKLIRYLLAHFTLQNIWCLWVYFHIRVINSCIWDIQVQFNGYERVLYNWLCMKQGPNTMYSTDQVNYNFEHKHTHPLTFHWGTIFWYFL